MAEQQAQPADMVQPMETDEQPLPTDESAAQAAIPVETAEQQERSAATARSMEAAEQQPPAEEQATELASPSEVAQQPPAEEVEIQAAPSAQIAEQPTAEIVAASAAAAEEMMIDTAEQQLPADEEVMQADATVATLDQLQAEDSHMARGDASDGDLSKQHEPTDEATVQAAPAAASAVELSEQPMLVDEAADSLRPSCPQVTEGGSEMEQLSTAEMPAKAAVELATAAEACGSSPPMQDHCRDLTDLFNPSPHAEPLPAAKQPGNAEVTPPGGEEKSVFSTRSPQSGPGQRSLTEFFERKFGRRGSPSSAGASPPPKRAASPAESLEKRHLQESCVEKESSQESPQAAAAAERSVAGC
eukprot:gnl/TRDRNA2_/TRDRNA2_169754_c0_seq5.p1 gnl/TRDRNA2_/TRDRNA2_169754_c0~~gnl/TRDRNA2_/TRDRNA2_169754_c0_seq5.p1  ORF type:complete len:386 (-),score=126.94 gnl/TRDRNA2_/TRDRNA2_169754_c0_seq5:267-1343(-)